MINKSELKDLLKEVMTPIISESIDKALKANFKRPDETENEWVNFKEAQKFLEICPGAPFTPCQAKLNSKK